MSEQTLIVEQTVPESPFPEPFAQTVVRDPRKGYEGYVVPPENLVAFATYVRDELGYDFLSSVTGVDYLPEGKMEVVYHVLKTTGGPPFVYKTQIPRPAGPLELGEVPSLVPVYPGAEFQEREIYDLYGIRFIGHPDLRRILMWEGFYGYPMRKDWREAYFEEEGKPFKNRWPEGHVYRAEDKNPFGKNVDYPAGFDPESWVPEPDAALYAGLGRVEGLDDDLETEQIVVNLGPQHPSTHGVFRMVVKLDGETILALKPVMGYLHRNHEKIGERNGWLQNIAYTDRLDYLCSMSNNLPYVLAVEKLLGVRVPERAEYIRVVMAELTRIVNHLLAIATYTNDLGAFFTPAMYAFEVRELILDLFEMASGARMMCNYLRFGGVAQDLPEEFLPLARELAAERLPRSVDEIDRLLTKNEVLLARSRGVGVLTARQAIACSVTGPMLRATGVKYDVRKAEPYSIYDRFAFDVPTGQHGDNYDRYLVRLAEIRESVRILQQALDQLPEGETLAGKKSWQVRVPAGEAYARVEAPKGELGFFVVSDGGTSPYRYHIRAPSLMNITALEALCKGSRIADFIAIFGSVDINMGELDR